ncbi:MAG: hypothetical protein LDLANPLL_02291 [Turneriella sp.]|nr:hypothetical protein [Turneriella sp.]
MVTDFFRRLIQIIAIASIAAVLYFNFLSVPSGYTAFLVSQVSSEGGLENRGVYQYGSGVTFVPTLFVPNRWQKFQIETRTKVQEIKIKLPLRYSAYLRLNDLFYVQLKIKIDGKIPENEAYNAIKALAWKPTEREKYIEEQFHLLASEFFMEVKEDEKNLERAKAQLITFFNRTNLAEVQKRLQTQLNSTWFTLQDIELKEIYVPDSALYAAQIRDLGDVAKADRAALLAQISKEADLALERKRNLEEIAKAERMGEMIRENPAILEYYKIEKIAPRAGSVILDVASGLKGEKNLPLDFKTKRGLDGKSENSEGGEIGRAN